MKDKYFRMLKFLFPDYSDSHIWGLIKLYYDKNNSHGKECAGENDVLHVVIESVCDKCDKPALYHLCGEHLIQTFEHERK